jgi:hypothetical protein
LRLDRVGPSHSEAIATLRDEVQRLAYASPPPAGRDQTVHELQQAVGALVMDEFGFLSWRRHFRSLAGALGALVLFFPVLLGANTLIRAARGRAPLWVQNPRFWASAPRDTIVVVAVFVGAFAWGYWQDQRRVRRALALAEGLRQRGGGASQPAA